MSSTPNRDERVRWVMSAPDYEELTQRYDTWANEYDQDLMTFGYNIPSVVAGLMGRYSVPGQGPVLDAGCGTGIAGQVLSVLGYRPLIGIDLSPGMLQVAESKGS